MSITKLVTKEDPFHIHKTLGILSISNFIYRYYYVYSKDGTLGYLEPTNFNILTMLIHFLLAFSAIQFRVPSKRIDGKPFIIYREYQLHAILFTGRCLLVYLFAIWNLQRYNWLMIITVHVAVDLVTLYHGKDGVTAVRHTGTYIDNYDYIGRRLFSYYQLLALGSHLIPNKHMADLGFNTLIAIQSSAFLMTLYKKRIIRGRTHRAIYGLALILSTYYIYITHNLFFFIQCLLIFYGRINDISKYALWGSFLIVNNYVLSN